MLIMPTIHDFITNTVELLFETSELKIDESSNGALHDFIHNPHKLLLQASIKCDNKLIFLENLQGNFKKSLILYKTLPQTLTNNSSLNNVNIITLSSSAAESLYQILRQIYSPLLATGDDLYSNKLQRNLLDLENNLRAVTCENKDDNINLILSIEDESDYWKTVGERRDASKTDRDAASSFCVLFEDINEEIRSMQSSALQEVKDSVENVAGILDDVWRQAGLAYAQVRMVHVIDVVGHIVCSIVQKTIAELNVWEVHRGVESGQILEELTHGLDVIQTWISACKSLTETYWPNYALHPWKGNSYVPLFCVNFEGRLKEVHHIRCTFNQLNKLLTNAEKSEFGIDDLFTPLQNVNVWIVNGPNHAWDSAASKFSASLRPAETRIAEKLKPRMSNASTQQILYEFQRYKTLIDRAVIKNALATELEWFVSSLLAMLEGIQSQLESDEDDVKMFRPAEMSPVVHKVQWAKQMEAKVDEIKTCTEKYLTEFGKSHQVVTLAGKLMRDLKEVYTQLVEEWARELQAQEKAGSLRLSLEKPVVEFSSENRLMVVNYNPRLAALEAEARALSALAPPPAAAARALATLAAALPHARALHQVASFHNTLGERMIPSTRPMMLQAALDLSALVQDQKPVYWNDEEQLTIYTDKLKNMVLKLESQNTYLTGQHIAIRNIVEQLMDTELLAQQARWKKGLKDIRDIIEKVEANGYKNTEVWRSHWDLQIYKALECQYIKTLLSLDAHFPSVKVDLVVRGNTVRLQPSMEELRAQHYAQLRRLAGMPALVTPLAARLADQTNIFSTIVHKHSWVGNKAVSRLEAAMAGVGAVRAKWAGHAAVCAVDLPALCAKHLTRAQDWDNNFKACKAYGQAVAKMSFEDEKINWITVSPLPLRRELEAQTRRLWGSLVASLQASRLADADQLSAYVASASLVLSDKTLPRNAKELAETSTKQQAIREKIPEMEELIEELKQKIYMLRTWGGDSSVDTTIKDWQRIREQLASQQELYEHQAETVKASLRGTWENLHGRVEAWMGRWRQAGVRLAEACAPTYAELAARAREALQAPPQLDQLVAEREELMVECNKFNLHLEPTNVWDDAAQLKEEFLALWNVLDEYDADYEALASQEWAVFQRRLHQLDELVSQWSGRLEPFTAVTLVIRRELDNYTDLTAALKYLRGTDFTERHWREIYGVLEMEPRPPETLTLRDLLQVAPSIKTHMKTIQKISSSASSEAAVRSTLNEIELWFAGARFSIVYYTDSAKRPIPIVKDYKDILTKVEEQQWAASAGGAAARGWLERLHAAAGLVVAAHAAQRRWLYLEPILAGDEGELGIKFRKVDVAFKQAARILESDPRLSVVLQSTRLRPMLDSISEQLNNCQSALNDYMDEKRTIFPRLYFLNDDDLLELLGQARAGDEGIEAVMHSHLKKLFPGITGVRLAPGKLSINALTSHFGETLQLDRPVGVDSPVEVWLKNLETEIRSTLKTLTRKSLRDNILQEPDALSLPTQVLCVAQSVRFTELAEKAIVSKELHQLKDTLERESSRYAHADVADEKEKYKRQALILQWDYHILAVQSLIESNVVSTNDWLWQKQLRFYSRSNDEIVAKMALAEVQYSYEYLGVQTGQFVRSDVTDECFLILTQSLHLGLVGNPFGPAGTGKTESVKALGALFGRLVLVFNCDEAMDAACLARLLRGLALSGAWGCLDEFNRLTAEALAAAAHQLAALMAGSQGDRKAVLDGKTVSVSAWCGVMVTMNPLGRGYGGRRELPTALAALLRPLALRPPDARDLAARLLAALHVPTEDARALADALQNVFSLASALLSGSRHYDWGLRALKAAVSGCGAALAARACRSRSDRLATLRAVLRLTNVSKLTQHDAHRFEKIISMVFTGVPEEESTTGPLDAALGAAVKKLNLIHNDFQIQKCKELYEQIQQRMGVAIVGPPGCGKTTIRRILKTALILQGESVSEWVIYPKAMRRSWLLGRAEPDTRQWTDGVVPAVATHAANQPSEVRSWMVYDGDVDPQWAEALNSLLDDNRLLALAGARVLLPARASALFETHHLDRASPATVSRLAIILLSEEHNCAPLVVQNWMLNADFDDDTAKISLPVLHSAINKCLLWLRANGSETHFKVQDIPLVQLIIAQFEDLVQNTLSRSAYASAEDMVQLALERSITGVVVDSAMDRFLEEVIGGVRFKQMNENVGLEEFESDKLVPSPRVLCAASCLRAALRAGRHALVLGPDASGKSLLVEQVLKELNGNVISVECTPLLEPADILTQLKRNNVLRSGGGSGAGGEPATLVVRGLQRARLDVWGDCPLHAFLLQVAGGGGAWECAGGEGPQWRRARVRLLATATTPSAVAPRLLAILSLIPLGEPDEDEIVELAKNRLRENIINNIPDGEINLLAKNIGLLYKDVTETFTRQPHYRWNASHVDTLCEDIKWYSATSSADVLVALNAESNMIFRERLLTEDERSRYNSISRKYIACGSGQVYLKPRSRGDGVYLQVVGYDEWSQNINQLINQCLTDDENAFGDDRVEACAELAVFCPAIALAMMGGVAVCVGGAGAGGPAAARLVCAAIGATVHFVVPGPPGTSSIDNTFKNALLTASEGARACVVLHAEGEERDMGESYNEDGDERSSAAATLSRVEALVRAHSVSALPDALARLAPSGQHSDTLRDIKRNLGIVICIDKDEISLGELMERFPMLHSNGRLVWVERWSEPTLSSLPALLTQRLMKENGQEMNKERLAAVPVEGFVSIYRSLRCERTRAPCKYVRLITAYCHIATRKQEALQQRKKMLAAGVEALRRARSEVATLQKDAAEQETALSVEQAKANQALEQISATVRANTDKKEEMHELKRSIEVENEKLQIRKEEIEEELSVVEPEIAAARAAVGDIRPEALSEIRSLRAPPDVVRDVLEGVLRLMGVADTSWHSMKNFLSKRGIKEDIRHLDAGSVSDEAAAAVARLVERRPASFEESTARRASAACAPLAAWVRAHLAHAEALRHVRPLRDAQENLKRKVRASESQLSALADGLASVEERVSALTRQLGGHTRAAAALELRLHAAAAAIQRATTLLQQLAHEYDAWEEQLEDITKELAEVNVRSLLAAAYIIYLPELTEPQARDMVREWAAVLGHDSLVFSVMNFLSTPETQLKWEADGLPADQSSVKNAIIIDQYLSEQNYGFTPLIVDPEGDVEAWLRKTLKDTPTDFVSQHSDKLKTALQYAAKLRRVLVITDVEEYAWWWGAVVGAGGGGPRALLVARSPLRTPPPPRFAAQLAIIHFAPRLHSLIDQLVHYTIQKQNPSLNDRYKEIKLQKAILQKQQYELQENLLKELSDNRDILHDENLMESLQKTRATSSTIASALSAAHDLEEEVGGACAKYTPTAARAAALTLAVKQLGVHSPLVTLPLEAVQQVFLEAVLRSAEPKDVNKDETVRYLMRRIIDRVLLSLHKRDKYVVVLHLLKQVYDDVVPDGLWKIFINHISVAQDKSSALEIKQHYHWIGDEFLNKLAQIKMQYEGLFDRLCLDKSDVWLEFQRSGDMAAIRHLQLEPFERVVAVAALRPQSAYRAVVAFVGHVLGGVRSGAALERAEQWTSCTRPALLLGAHAALQLTVHAQARSRSLTEVGIDEGLSAWEAALRNCRNGGWLAIVVGASAFPRDLYTFVSGLSSLPMEERPSEEFRLWLVTEERDVPPALAHACLGVVLEAPEGVKYNVCGTLGAWAGVRAPPPLLRHFAALALFHAVVQERRAYLPLGWSRWYAWEWGEVSASRRAAEGAGAGRAARELCGALYAARAGEARDRRVVHALLRTLLDASLQRNWRPPSMPAPLPLYTDISTYMEAFSALPDMDPPELLALPANCRVAWEQNAADNIVAGLREYDTTVIIRKHESTAPVKTILALWKKLMAGSPLIRGEFGVDAASDGNSGWWACVCAAEARDAAVVTRTVHAALARLAHAPPTANHALDKVPDEWQLLWPGPEIPELYIKEFCHRASAAVDRLQECRRSGGDIPKELDVRTLMRVSRVLSALRARAAERTALPPHALVLAVTWGAHSVEEDGVVVRGLRMSGGEWVANGGGAGEVRPAPATAPPDTPAPPLLLRYVPAAHEFSTTEDGADSRVGFRACVYSDASRSAVVWRARAPLATLFTPDMAELHALALHVAPV